MSSGALVYAGMKKIAKDVVKRAEKFAVESPKIRESALKRLSKMSENTKFVLSPLERLCIRRPDKIINDICNGLIREGFFKENWNMVSLEGKKSMIQKAASVISRECLMPYEMRSEIEVCFNPDAGGIAAEKGKPLVYIDECKLGSADITDVLSNVFQQVWGIDAVSDTNISIDADVELFKETFDYQSLNSIWVQSPITASLETPEVFSDFIGENTENCKIGMSVEEAKAKLEEIRGWIKEVNPNYSPWTPYGSNCGTCAYIVEKSIDEGRLICEAGSVNIAPTDPEMEALTGYKCEYMSVADIENILKSRGPGSHLIVGINRNRGSGHWFNAYYDGEKIYTVDGQNGTIKDWPHDYGDVSAWCAMV